jgi:hypothetical protein
VNGFYGVILQLFGDAEILFVLGDPSTDLAEELSSLDQVLVYLRELLDIADIIQVT